MRLIPLCGVVILFGAISVYFTNKYAIAITLNGFLCHSFETMHYFKFWDIICNILFLIILAIKNDTLIKFMLVAIAIYIINMHLFNNKYISRYISEIIHVCGIQCVLWYALLNDCILNYKI